MFKESGATFEKIEIPQKIEFYIKSEEDIKNIEAWLKNFLKEEAAEQCAFVLKSMAEKDFVNHCNEATQAFGKNLAENFGGEESFFDLEKSAEFFDMRTYSKNTKMKKLDKGHSVAVIEFRTESDSTNSIIFDLTYNTVTSSDKKLIINAGGNIEEAKKVLKEQYGGNWNVEFKFDKEKRQFVFNE